MRTLAILMATAGLTGCGIAQMLPEGPVLTPWERSRGWPGTGASGATYTSDPAVAMPVLPILAWGAAYDVDLVIVDRDPAWDMHEYAMLRTPTGPLWLAKDARMGTLDQYVTADLPDIDGFLPELPVFRKAGPVAVDDRSTADRVDVTIRYTNPDGKAVVAHFDGPPPDEAEKQRNGSTMGHSRNSLLAVLDLPYSSFGRHASMTYDGVRSPIYKLGGLVGFDMALVQTQAGLGIGHLTESPGDATSFSAAFHMRDGASVPTSWSIVPGSPRFLVVQEQPWRRVEYGFTSGDAWELADVAVYQWDRAAPTCHVSLSPPLPDLRRKFDGHVRSRYVIDVNGDQSHAIGTLDAYWDADGPHVDLLPEAPWWTADRPMRTSIRYPGDGTADVEVVRVPTDARTGSGGKNRSKVQVPTTATSSSSSP